MASLVDTSDLIGALYVFMLDEQLNNTTITFLNGI